MRRRSLAFTAVAIALIALPAFAAPVLAAKPVKTEHQRIVEYWTPARMAAARPRDMVLSKSGRLIQPLVTNSGGQSWPTGTANAGGLIAAVEGRVYFNLGGGLYVCSGSVVNDGRPDYSLVLTAGHCVYDQASKTWATNWLFIPNADGLGIAVPPPCDQSVRGCWTASALVAHTRFTSASGFSATAAHYDYAFAVVGAGGKANDQLDADGPDAGSAPDSLPIAYSGVVSGTQMYAFGYPAAAPYAGNDLVYCSGRIGQDFFNFNRTWSIVCNMTGGASGGGWLSGFSESTGSGTLGSLNSYRYSFSNRMYGPKFTSATQVVFNAANAATTGTISVQ
jgi:hypothetical protein